MWKAFREDAWEEIRKGCARYTDLLRWPLDEVLNAVNAAASMDQSVNRKGEGRDWTVVTSRLVAIYREEMAKPRRIDLWNMAQKNAEDG